MKIYISLLICLFSLNVFCQCIGTIDFSNRMNVKYDLNFEVKKENLFFEGFPTNCESIFTIRNDSASVRFYTFKYNPSDSVEFENAILNYWIVSGCNIELNSDINKNFYSFHYNGNYYLLEHCACNTKENEYCANLAAQIFMLFVD
jgi:hypothetical protein